MDNKTIFINKHRHATLYRVLEDGLLYVEGPRLLDHFFLGNPVNVGSLFTRTFGSDSWYTTAVQDITDIKPLASDHSRIYFRTRNTEYALEVSTDAIEYRSDLNPILNATDEDVRAMLVIAYKELENEKRGQET